MPPSPTVPAHGVVAGPRQSGADAREVYLRHRWPVRVMHWINVVCVTLLVMSGLNIFNAHPALYWGRDSNFAAPLLSITSKDTPAGARGVLRIGGAEFDTTGVLGRSKSPDGSGDAARAFPSWATVPGPQWLALARQWHLFFAWIFVLNGAAYLLYTVLGGHLRRDLLPTPSELRGIPKSIKDHALLHHAHGDTPRRNNVLQNLAYLAVVFVVLPMIVLGGWALSPMINSLAPGWVDFFGGRQALRTLHFIGMSLLIAFIFVHVFEVAVTGLFNNLRSMITGYWTVPK